MTAGECIKHPGTQRVEMKNSRGGKYYACPTCVAEKKGQGGGLPPSPRPPKAAKKTAKKAVKKAAKKSLTPPAPPAPPPAKGSAIRRFFSVHGIG